MRPLERCVYIPEGYSENLGSSPSHLHRTEVSLPPFREGSCPVYKERVHSTHQWSVQLLMEEDFPSGSHHIPSWVRTEVRENHTCINGKVINMKSVSDLMYTFRINKDDY